MNETVTVPIDFFNALMMAGRIVDGRAGGLVLGRSHAEGGILMIQRNAFETFSFVGTLEGGEFLVNWDAYQASPDRITAIRTEKIEEVGMFEPRVTSPKTRIINTHASPDDKIIWIEGRGVVIISKTRTRRFLDELEVLNEQENTYARFSLADYFA